MMRAYKRIISYVLVVFITLLAWSICLTNAQKIQVLQDVVELRYDREKLDVRTMKNLQKGESESSEKIVKSFIAWEQSPKEDLRNKELAKNVTGEVVKVYGNLTMLFPVEKLQGQTLYEGDREGTIISEGVAYSLWGSTDVVGQSLIVGDKAYVVRGVLKEKSNRIITQADMADKETKFSALRVQLVDKENVEGVISTLKFKYNLPESLLRNLSLTSILLSGLALLPGYLLGFYGLIKLYKFIYSTHRYWVSAILLSIIALGLTWITIEMMQFITYIPSYIIPNKWSDFTFWSKLIDGFIENSRQLQALPALIGDGWYNGIKAMIVGGFSITCIGMLAFSKIAKVEEGKTLFYSTLGAIMLSFITIMLVYHLEGQVTMIEAFWGVMPMYLLITFIINKWTKLLS